MSQPNLLLSDDDFVRLLSLSPPPELRAELERAIVVPVESMSPDVVGMHSRVRYCDESSGQLREVELVYPDEVDIAAGRISVLAPVGAALIGVSVGQTIDWPFPDGRPRTLRVVEVLPPPAEAGSAGVEETPA
ncbi:nucleoside diphosphate kinase regulator [Azonexus sp. R2A61]|uniref:nucleoside diphosphate kinase regulator n=1 Tax=Azonexus sp. R2A61 TaxID=2744443 RepID=UPI001F282529|nr:nucleoside diphosphate kinase regulator [Azonexus sp. R2A61]